MKQLVAFLFLLLAGFVVYAADHADVADHPSCKYCGMDRGKFAHSRMLIEYDDGTLVPTCSLHCVAVDLANNLDRSPRAIKVADNNSFALIDAETASWVVGGNRPGVMSARGKWAFADHTQAEKFMTENGGDSVTFEAAIKEAYADMYKDTRMIRDKRKARK